MLMNTSVYYTTSVNVNCINYASWEYISGKHISFITYRLIRFYGHHRVGLYSYERKICLYLDMNGMNDLSKVIFSKLW